MQKIQVQFELPELVRVKEGMGKNGKPYKISEQRCAALGIGRYPVEMWIRVPDGAVPYKVGVYDVQDLVTVGRYGFEISRDFFLTSASADAKKAA
jgi:hypothetical protein